MTDYIEREAAIKRFNFAVLDCLGMEPTIRAGDIIKALESIPAADVWPVVKAKWEWNDNNGYYYCGNCKAVSPREDQDGEYIDCPNFCPNCGAVMREEQDGR